MDEAGDALEEGGGGQIDDFAVLLRLHIGRDGADHEPHAPYVDVLHVVPFVDRPLVERPPCAHPAEEGRVVHQDVDAPAEGFRHLLHRSLALGKVGDVAGHRHRDPARGFDFVGHLGCAFAVDVEHGHPRSFPRVTQADRPPDAVGAAATGDYRYLAVQTTGRSDRVSHDARLSPVLALQRVPRPYYERVTDGSNPGNLRVRKARR